MRVSYWNGTLNEEARGRHERLLRPLPHGLFAAPEQMLVAKHPVRRRFHQEPHRGGCRIAASVSEDRRPPPCSEGP